MRYEKIILGRIRCEKAPQVVTNKSLNDKCLHYRTMIWRRFLPFQNPDYNDVKSHLVAIVLQISLRILHCWTILLLLARPNNNLKTNVFFQERRPALQRIQIAAMFSLPAQGRNILANISAQCFSYHHTLILSDTMKSFVTLNELKPFNLSQLIFNIKI